MSGSHIQTEHWSAFTSKRVSDLYRSGNNPEVIIEMSSIFESGAPSSNVKISDLDILQTLNHGISALPFFSENNWNWRI